MESSLQALLSIFLILLSAFFVAAEYSLVASRRSKVETLAQNGSRTAVKLLSILDQTSKYVASIQVGITVCGLALGSLTEPLLGASLKRTFGTGVPESVSFILSLLIVTFVLVVVGELLPKLVTLQNPERVALLLTRPMVFASLVLLPFAWAVQKGGALLLRPFGIDPEKMDSPSISREELALLVRAGESEGIIEETHADVVSKALRFDKLDSADIMIHRLDMKWIDVDLTREEVIAACAKIPHSRVPVCRGDVDDVVGILYVLDLIRKPQVEPFSLESLVRPVEVVPENLTLTKVINRMRESRTQILVVRDEYGGTSGLITLEDVVEEVFGEIEDQIESERPVIEQITSIRYSVRAEVRFDELLDFLDIDSIPRHNTETLATILVESLQRMPRLGDSIQTEIGTMIIENMARQRITRVRVLLSPETLALMEAESQD